MEAAAESVDTVAASFTTSHRMIVERRRLQVLRETGILELSDPQIASSSFEGGEEGTLIDRGDGSTRTTGFDRYTSFMQRALDVSFSLISLVDADRVCFKSINGSSSNECSFDVHELMPRESSFCHYTIAAASSSSSSSWGCYDDGKIATVTTAVDTNIGIDDRMNDGSVVSSVTTSGRVFVVEDALKDERFAATPLVVGKPYIRSYAGVPICVEGLAVGAFCVMDVRPRKFTSDEIENLVCMGEIFADIFRGRRAMNLDLYSMQSSLISQTHKNLRAPLQVIDKVTSILDMSLREELKRMQQEEEQENAVEIKIANKEDHDDVVLVVPRYSELIGRAQQQLKIALSHLDLLVESSVSLAEFILDFSSPSSTSGSDQLVDLPFLVLPLSSAPSTELSDNVSVASSPPVGIVPSSSTGHTTPLKSSGAASPLSSSGCGPTTAAAGITAPEAVIITNKQEDEVEEKWLGGQGSRSGEDPGGGCGRSTCSTSSTTLTVRADDSYSSTTSSTARLLSASSSSSGRHFLGGTTTTAAADDDYDGIGRVGGGGAATTSSSRSSSTRGGGTGTTQQAAYALLESTLSCDEYEYDNEWTSATEALLLQKQQEHLQHGATRDHQGGGGGTNTSSKKLPAATSSSESKRKQRPVSPRIRPPHRPGDSLLDQEESTSAMRLDILIRSAVQKLSSAVVYKDTHNFGIHLEAGAEAEKYLISGRVHRSSLRVAKVVNFLMLRYLEHLACEWYNIDIVARYEPSLFVISSAADMVAKGNDDSSSKKEYQKNIGEVALIGASAATERKEEEEEEEDNEEKLSSSARSSPTNKDGGCAPPPRGEGEQTAADDNRFSLSLAAAAKDEPPQIGRPSVPSSSTTPLSNISPRGYAISGSGGIGKNTSKQQDREQQQRGTIFTITPSLSSASYLLRRGSSSSVKGEEVEVNGGAASSTNSTWFREEVEECSTDDGKVEEEEVNKLMASGHLYIEFRTSGHRRGSSQQQQQQPGALSFIEEATQLSFFSFDQLVTAVTGEMSMSGDGDGEVIECMLPMTVVVTAEDMLRPLADKDVSSLNSTQSTSSSFATTVAENMEEGGEAHANAASTASQAGELSALQVGQQLQQQQPPQRGGFPGRRYFRSSFNAAKGILFNKRLEAVVEEHQSDPSLCDDEERLLLLASRPPPPAVIASSPTAPQRQSSSSGSTRRGSKGSSGGHLTPEPSPTASIKDAIISAAAGVGAAAAQSMRLPRVLTTPKSSSSSSKHHDNNKNSTSSLAPEGDDSDRRSEEEQESISIASLILGGSSRRGSKSTDISSNNSKEEVIKRSEEGPVIVVASTVDARKSSSPPPPFAAAPADAEQDQSSTRRGSRGAGIPVPSVVDFTCSDFGKRGGTMAVSSTALNSAAEIVSVVVMADDKVAATAAGVVAISKAALKPPDMPAPSTRSPRSPNIPAAITVGRGGRNAAHFRSPLLSSSSSPSSSSSSTKKEKEEEVEASSTSSTSSAPK